MVWDPIKDAKKAAEKEAKKIIDKVIKPAENAAKSAVNKAGDGVRSGIRKVGSEIEGKVKKVGGEVEDSFKVVGHEIEEGLEKTGREIEEGITKKLPELAEDAIEEIIKKATEDSVKKGLNMALDLIEMGSPDSFSLFFGVELALVATVNFSVSVAVPNPMANLTKIRKWAKDAPSGRSEIIDCIKDFAPSSIGVKAVVCGNGATLTWSADNKFEMLDKFLAEQGV